MSKQEVKPNPDNEMLGTIDEPGDRSQYHNLVDILFVIDTTGSMGWCISQMKKTICKIMKKFSDKQYNIKFAITVYRDHPPQEYSYVEKHFDLRNQDAIIKVIDSQMDPGGGGDTPEAVFDGLLSGLRKTSWRISTDGKTKSKRFLFHGCDAPPHGKEYGSNSSDKSWSEKGCPCGLTRHDVNTQLNKHQVDYSLIKCGNSVQVMGSLFKQCFGDKFKREMEIHPSRGGGRRRRGGRQRKLSEEYMQDLEAEQVEQACQKIKGSKKGKNKKCKKRVRKEEQKPTLLSSVKNFFAPSKGKEEMQHQQCLQSVAPSPCAMAQLSAGSQQQSNSSEDEDGNRSMASLVLSDIEDGVGSYFEDEQIKKQKKSKK